MFSGCSRKKAAQTSGGKLSSGTLGTGSTASCRSYLSSARCSVGCGTAHSKKSLSDLTEYLTVFIVSLQKGHLGFFFAHRRAQP